MREGFLGRIPKVVLGLRGLWGEFYGWNRRHRCGAFARCTTCRVEFLEGEPEKMTQAEREVLESRDLLGQVRLSYQSLCDHDVKVRVLMTVTSSGLDSPGPKPEPEIAPPPEWVEKPA